MLYRETLIRKRKPGYYVEVRTNDTWHNETRVVADWFFPTAAAVEELLDRVGSYDGQQTLLSELEAVHEEWEGLHIVEVCADGREFVVDRYSPGYLASERLAMATHPGRYTGNLDPVETGL